MRFCETPLLFLLVLSTAAAKPKVAIINVQRAIVSTQDGKAAAAALAIKYAPDQARMAKEQQEIDELNRQLSDGTAQTEQDSAQLKARIDASVRTHRRNEEDLRAKFEQDRKQVLADL